ncbi:MAG: SDR family NAD(P)-dependent oxidoreductase, partial [Solirubrobacterales bacterium]|nr:SDR family NAD(P)-dependent oxidoreductase [Solirubrobacterales bacterium]
MSGANTENVTTKPLARRSARDQIVVITGASSGLGLETAKQLAAEGAEVVMVCRDRSRGERAQSQVAAVATRKTPVLVLADLSVRAEVRRAAEEIGDRYDRVDILINNAGGAYRTRDLSADGIERTWATNHLAPFLLTELLLPLLIAAPSGRVVNVTSEIYSRKLDLDNVEGERNYSFFGAYRTSKLGNVLFTRELAKRLAGSGVTALSVSPGPAKTNFGGGGPGGVMGAITRVMQRTPLFRPAEQAARGIVWAATAPELASSPGGLYMRRKELKLKGAAADSALAEQVWAISESQTGIDPCASSVSSVSARSSESAPPASNKAPLVDQLVQKL